MGNNATTVSLRDAAHTHKKNYKKAKCDFIAHAVDNQKKKGAKKTGMIPEPDYCDEGEDDRRFSKDGLVIPKKPHNPCLESNERQSLHRELLFNQKIGKSVIGQKTELHRAFAKLREDQLRKEAEEERVLKKSALQRRLEEQANKIKQQEEELETKKAEEAEQPEFLRVHARVCAQAVDSTS